MPKVVGIKFAKSNRLYYFEAGDLEYKLDGGVIVETVRGMEYGYVTQLPKEVTDDEIVAPLKPVMRIATAKDTESMKKYAAKHDEVMVIAQEKIDKSGLEMKLIDAEYTFDGSKLLIYFTADGRVDFRELVKDLVSSFHVRIELRQIGARDECKRVGGIGPCGRVCCCCKHMSDYPHVSIKMAKNQNLSLNPTKISGLCGRLMCCLEYENAHYTETNKKMPKMGATITLKDKRQGVVTALNQLKEKVKVKIEDNDKCEFVDVGLDEIVNKGKGSNLDDVSKQEKLDNELKNLID